MKVQAAATTGASAWRRALLGSAAAAVLCAAPASAQQTVNVLLSANDAFGERAGQESVGLYNENQVRGFNLFTTGAYRINGAYFAIEGGLPDTLIDGASVRVGMASTRLDYPSPSGVVEYRLKSPPASGEYLTVDTGTRGHFSPFLLFDGGVSNASGNVGIAAGVMLRPHDRFGDGPHGKVATMGTTLVLKPSDDITIQPYIAYEGDSYDGDSEFTSTVAALPVGLRAGHQYSPPWARSVHRKINGGSLAEWNAGDGRWVKGSLFYSEQRDGRMDDTVLFVNPNGTATATMYRSPGVDHRSISTEWRAGQNFALGETQNEFTVGIRNRWSIASIGDFIPTDLGPYDLTGATYPAALPPVIIDRNHERTDQLTFSGTYRVRAWDRIELRAGVHHTRYEKTVHPAGGPLTSRTDQQWLYDAAAIFVINPTVQLFATYTKGIEDSGAAPSTAANGNAVLPAVIAEGYDGGVKINMGKESALILSAFSLKKPFPGLRPDNFYALVGDIKNRGVEVSLNGKITDGLSVVFGALHMSPRLSGVLVSANAIGRKPVAIPENLVVGGLDWKVPGQTLEGLSLDTHATWQSAQEADALNTFRAPGFASVDIGARYKFTAGGYPMQLRVLAINAFDKYSWIVNPGGTFYLNAPTFVRVALSVKFAA